MQFSIRAVELVDNDRKKVIIERTIQLIPTLKNRNYGLQEKLDRAYYLYKKNYKETLNIRELTILCLYIIFPDDNNFLSMLEHSNNDFDKIGKLYSMNGKIAKLRYDCYLSLNNNKILELK